MPEVVRRRRKAHNTMTDITHITDRERALAKRVEELEAWQPIESAMPESGQTVLACYKNSAGNWRRIRAQWIAAKSRESNIDGDIGEYDEEADTYYDPEGWYEQIDNWAEYTSCTVDEGVVSHWQELPPPPKATP